MPDRWLAGADSKLTITTTVLSNYSLCRDRSGTIALIISASKCRKGQSPRDRELDVEGVFCSPGVRRMMAVVGSEASFDQGREHLELLSGIELTAKAVERQAEAIGGDIEACQ